MFADTPCGQRALSGTLDVAVEVAVCVVVDDAACGAHQDDADDENDQRADIRNPLGGQPECPECWPEQQVGADRAVQPHQLNVVIDLGVDARNGFDQQAKQKRFSREKTDTQVPASGQPCKNTSHTSSCNLPSEKCERRAHRPSLRQLAGSRSAG